MATVMTFTAPAAALPLGAVFEQLPAATIELERLIPHEPSIIPYVWIRGADGDAVESALEVAPAVTDTKLVDSVADEHLLRAEWNRETVGLLHALAEADLVVLSATGTSDGWRFEVRADNRDELATFQTACRESDIPIDITTIHALLPISGAGYELTDTQREALVAAYDHGYFDSPRTATLAEVAADIGITQQSLSSRLRRGHRRLIRATLIHE